MSHDPNHDPGAATDGTGTPDLPAGRDPGAADAADAARITFSAIAPPLLPPLCALAITGAQTAWLPLAAAAASVRAVGAAPVAAVLAAYAAWCKVDTTAWRESYKSDLFRRSMFWRMVRAYYPHRFIKTAPLPPESQYILGVHPHGTLSVSVPITFGSEAAGFSTLYPGLDLRVGVVNLPFYVPVQREICIASGCVSADKKVVDFNLAKGRSMVLVVGGAAEALMAGRTDAMYLVLKDRKGFVRQALRNGVALVPCLALGETSTFYHVESEMMAKTQLWLMRKLGFSLPVFFSTRLLMPLRCPLTTVVGAPIAAPARVDQADPDFDAKVDELHALYVKRLTELHAKYAPLYGTKADQVLRVITQAESLQLLMPAQSKL